MKRVIVAWMFMLGLALPAWAIEPVGSIANVFGKVSLMRNGKTYTAAQGQKLYNGDSVAVANDSFAKLLLTDDSLLTVGENSTFKVENVKREANSRIGQFRLMFGKVRAIVSKFGAGKTDYRFVTPTAVAGVRGTHLVVEYDSATQKTTLSVVEGSVGFKALEPPGGSSGAGTEVIVGTLQRSEQKAGAPAAEPVKLNDEQIKQLDTEISTQTPATEDEGAPSGKSNQKPAGSGAGGEKPQDESSAEPGDQESRVDQNIERVEQAVGNDTNAAQQENPAVNPATQTGVRVRW